MAASDQRSDIQLFEAFKKGDAGAFEALYDRYGDRIYGYLLALVGNGEEARDLSQQLFLELIARAKSTAIKGSFCGYVFAAARHRATDLLRRRSSAKGVAADFLVARRASGDSKFAERSAALNRAMAALPQETRELIVLKFYEDLTFAELGEVLGVPEKTADSRYRAAIEKLRRTLTSELKGPGQ